MLKAKIKYHPKGEQLIFQLLNSYGQVIATSEDGIIDIRGLVCGNYIFRVIGPPMDKPVDFSIKSKQGLPYDHDD